MEDARDLWDKIRKAHGDDAWGLLAGQHLQALDGVADQEQALLEVFRRWIGVEGVEPAVIDESFTGLPGQALLAVRYEHLGDALAPPTKGDLARAASECETLKAQAEERLSEGDLRALPWWVFGAIKAARLKEDAQAAGEVAAEHRAELVKKAVGQAAALVQSNGNLLKARALCMDVITLYGDDPESTEGMSADLKTARQLLEALASQNYPPRFR